MGGKPALVRGDAKQMFSGATVSAVEWAYPKGKILHGKPCRIVIATGNLACYVFRRNFRWFRLTPPIREHWASWKAKGDAMLAEKYKNTQTACNTFQIRGGNSVQ